VYPEVEEEGRWHGAQVGWGCSKKETKKEEDPVKPYKAESRHDAWHDSVAPKHVARLNLAMSATFSGVAGRSRQNMQRDPSRSPATRFDVTKKTSSWKFRSDELLLKY
jgi:hypothetical protein